MKKWNVAIIGLGFVGKLHYDALRRLPNVHVRTIVVHKAQDIPLVKENYDADVVTDCWQEAVADPQIQVIHNCTPNALHDEINLAAIGAGKHLYAEKPMSLTTAGAEEVLCAPFSESLAKISGGAECYFVVVTRAHNCDLECLTAILQKPAAYVGMMGSRGRTALVRRQLTEAGLDPARVEALHAPIGLAIGAKTAEEIALSILAEIIQIKSARPLTEGFSPAILAALGALDTPAVLATIVSRHGSTPREVGSKMLLLPDGRTVGSVGGGIMEYRVQQLAAKMLAGEEPPTKLAAFTTDGTGEDAAIAACGGSMNVLLQRMEPEENSDEA